MQHFLQQPFCRTSLKGCFWSRLYTYNFTEWLSKILNTFLKKLFFATSTCLWHTYRPASISFLVHFCFQIAKTPLQKAIFLWKSKVEKEVFVFEKTTTEIKATNWKWAQINNTLYEPERTSGQRKVSILHLLPNRYLLAQVSF